jgi:hypothetical protein
VNFSHSNLGYSPTNTKRSGFVKTLEPDRQSAKKNVFEMLSKLMEISSNFVEQT